jgi:hypothetical protein
LYVVQMLREVRELARLIDFSDGIDAKREAGIMVCELQPSCGVMVPAESVPRQS